MAKIGIIDADLLDHGTRHPNLALMKIAGYYREQGHEVSLLYKSFEEAKDDSFDELYMGCVFNFTKVPEEIKNLPNMVQYGGTGFFPDGGPNLKPEIEHHMPYYELYRPYVEYEIAKGRKPGYFDDYMYYSIGFTSRGCFRKCEFCVNKKYDHAFRHSPVQEFLDPIRPYIYLWDDNILALPEWEEVIDELEATGKPYQFRQGIDLRLMTDHKAYRMVNARYHGDFIFAFDHLKDRDLIVEKVQLWKRYSSRICKMYVISGYNSQDEHDIEDVFERIRILMTYGSLPYIMRYEAYKNSPYRDIYVQLARWCNQPQFFKKKSFREFCEANQDYKKDKTTNCSALQSMLDFEKKFPQIAKKYFDLRFDQLNIYQTQYGYGRRYANKPLCSECKKNGLCWDKLINQPRQMVQAYLTKQVDIGCLQYKNTECDSKPEYVVVTLVDALMHFSIKECIGLIRQEDSFEDIRKDNIPQFGTLKMAIIDTPQILSDSGEQSMSFNRIGRYLKDRNKNAKIETDQARNKYGENHAKFAALLGLSYVIKNSKATEVFASELGKYYATLCMSNQQQLALRLCLRIPIIRKYFLGGQDKDIITEEMKILSLSTQYRRRSNVDLVIRSIVEGDIRTNTMDRCDDIES